MLENELEFKPLGGTRLVLTIDRALCSVHVDSLWESGCPQGNHNPTAGDLAALEKAFAAVKASLLASEQENDAPELKQLGCVDVRTDANFEPVIIHAPLPKPTPEIPEISLPDLEAAQGKLAQLKQLAEMVASKPGLAKPTPPTGSPEPREPAPPTPAPEDAPKPSARPAPPTEVDTVTSFDFTPTPDPDVESAAPGESKQQDILDAYRNVPMGKKGTMSRREARSQVKWEAGNQYKGAGKVIQCGVDESDDNPHGAFWTLTLDNGDVVTTDLLGKELTYDCAEDSRAPDWMDPEGELPAVPVPKPFDILSIPDGIAKTVGTSTVLDWMLDTVPALADDMERCIALCVKYEPKLRTFRGMDEAKIRRRVESLLPPCILRRAQPSA